MLGQVDVLSDLLSRARARGALFGHWRLSGPWGLEFDDGGLPLSLHTVLAGELTCERDGAPVVRARQGDLLLMPGGRYRFVHQPGAPARPVAEVLARGPVPGTARTYSAGGGPPAPQAARDGQGAELVCGAYTFDGGLCSSVLAALPSVTVIPSAGNGRLNTMLSLLAEEAGSGAPGQQTVLDKLLDLLLVSALRAHWAAPGATPPRWFSALGDPIAGPALRALHEAPARPWTVADLAAHAGVSRATLARRFAATTGLPPIAYLTRWRMELAKEALRSPQATLVSIARDIGYSDEFALAAAFKREVGIPPGQYRGLIAQAMQQPAKRAS
jgi:AraC-like DNA-binding protein